MPENENLVNPNATSLESQPYIQQSVTALPQNAIDYEQECIVFSFDSYYHNKCEIRNLTNNEPKQLTTALEKTCQTRVNKLLHNGKCRHVINRQNYSDLFNDLPDGVQLLEIDYTDQGRIFGFLTRNIFNVKVILKKHKKY